MENNENLVTEQVTENVEKTTEESPKLYTQAEFDEKVRSTVDESLGKKIARNEAKIRKEYNKKYGELEDVLKAGTGKESVEEITDSLKEFYQQQGVKIHEKPAYAAKDIEVLAKADAEDIIRYGYDEVVEEVDRLTALGADNMTAREKAAFKVLAEHRRNAERSKKLAEMGVSEDVYNSKEFNEFAAKFTHNTPITEIYDIYNKAHPKKEIRTMGSMKNNATDDGGVKDFYSYEEAMKFTKEDFDKNPALYKKVQESMQKW